MRAEEYNKKQMDSGLLGVREITEMVRVYQAKHDLSVDGMCGPKTLGLLAPDDELSSNFGLRMLEEARRTIGCGETEGNNRGPFIEMLFGKENASGAWCAAAVSYWARKAAEAFGVDMPFKQSFGAKRLYKNVIDSNKRVAEPRPGDVVCWHRSSNPGSWMGHIGIVSDYSPGSGIFTTIEGNKGRYPAKVREFQHDIDEPMLMGFARPPSV